MTLGGLTFLAPLALLGLLALPVIWWLLKVSPPRPRQLVFPPLSILRGVETEEETPDSTPWWVLLFRLAMIALIAVALARPVWQAVEPGQGELTLIVDDSWVGAASWSQISREAQTRALDARRANRQMRLGLLSDGSLTSSLAAQDVLDRLDTLRPRAVDPSLPTDMPSDAVLLSGGLMPAGVDVDATVLAPGRLPIVPGTPRATADGFAVPHRRYRTGGPQGFAVTAYASDGTVLARTQGRFDMGVAMTDAVFELPSELRNRVAQLRVDGLSSAGTTWLLDSAWGRPTIGVVNPLDDSGSPLLSDPFYARNAIAPYADVYEGPLADVLARRPSIIILPDAARGDMAPLEAFVEDGGILVRFAGDKLAANPDNLLPVDLRIGGRSLGGALTWDEPQTVGAFAPDSPFFGLDVPDDIRVDRQLMAEPSAETDLRSWARLVDGSPIVTSATRGQGRIVFFHVTAGPDWSNLAVSGLYVEMLRRILPFAVQRAAPVTETSGDWIADQVMDGFGRLQSPGAGVTSIEAGAFDDARSGPSTPPGYYQQGVRRRALNTVADPAAFQAIRATGGFGADGQRRLSGWLLGVVAVMICIDAIIALWTSGRLSRVLPGRGAVAALGVWLILPVLAGVLVATDAHAQTQTPDAATDLYLAYVETGDPSTDRLSEAGLEGVAQALRQRTTIEPAGVVGVVPGEDPLIFHPFLYFPVDRNAPALAPDAAQALNAYMASGGTIVFDTADHGESALRDGPNPGLIRITESLDMPPITGISEDHVLTKSFYLLQLFPGRWSAGKTWVASNTTDGTDGVSPVVVGSNDWAAAWAIDGDGGQLLSLENDIPRQRETALRFGVNLAMYALSGNYKADQVHTAELVKRLGRDIGSSE